ncbi:hypothetical protein PIROE2DRAFT_3521 [Piromyces sp. E2]|nr:hypothetical protein PIROE2DRAFT_3521 [Piromyces sp. E2]|eukprot:OUM68679.1 hypothetical protein PIROE2DRAFT_3521 [Piromyces sp. E2]
MTYMSIKNYNGNITRILAVYVYITDRIKKNKDQKNTLKIIEYLESTIDYNLIFGKEVHIWVYFVANFARDKNTRSLTTDYYMLDFFNELNFILKTIDINIDNKGTIIINVFTKYVKGTTNDSNDCFQKEYKNKIFNLKIKNFNFKSTY